MNRKKYVLHWLIACVAASYCLVLFATRSAESYMMRIAILAFAMVFLAVFLVLPPVDTDRNVVRNGRIPLFLLFLVQVAIIYGAIRKLRDFSAVPDQWKTFLVLYFCLAVIGAALCAFAFFLSHHPPRAVTEEPLPEYNDVKTLVARIFAVLAAIPCVVFFVIAIVLKTTVDNKYLSKFLIFALCALLILNGAQFFLPHYRKDANAYRSYTYPAMAECVLLLFAIYCAFGFKIVDNGKENALYSFIIILSILFFILSLIVFFVVILMPNYQKEPRAASPAEKRARLFAPNFLEIELIRGTAFLSFVTALPILIIFFAIGVYFRGTWPLLLLLVFEFALDLFFVLPVCRKDGKRRGFNLALSMSILMNVLKTIVLRNTYPPFLLLSVLTVLFGLFAVAAPPPYPKRSDNRIPTRPSREDLNEDEFIGGNDTD